MGAAPDAGGHGYVAAERAALADTLLRVGPDAPTLDESWRARDLAAHLVLRERRPDAALGIALHPLAAHTRTVQRRLASLPWPDLVARFRSGPPPWSPTRLHPLDEAANLLELVVHHEDVLRAQPGWRPRELTPALDDEIWRRLRRMARLLARRVPCTVRLERAGGDCLELRPGQERTVTLHGPVLELLVYVFGRGRAARVEASGDRDALATLPDTFGGF